MLSLCTLSTVSTLNTLPSLSLKLHDIMIMKRPEVSLTLHDLKSAFESIAQLRCCFKQGNVSVCSIHMSGEKFDDSSLNYSEWSFSTYSNFEREDEPEPEYKTTLSVQWSSVSSSSLNHEIVLEYNCVPSIWRQNGLRLDANAIVTNHMVPIHSLKLINVDRVIKNSKLTICPAHCSLCNKRRCGICFPCKDCPFCSKSVCKKCVFKYKCDFCPAWCCEACEEQDEEELEYPRSSYIKCVGCLKRKCTNCKSKSGEEWLTYLECCEVSLCLDCSPKREIFTCSTCSYSNCDECADSYNGFELVTKCKQCGQVGCQNCNTSVFCNKCDKNVCKSCERRFECSCGCCLCQSCGEESLDATFIFKRGDDDREMNWHENHCLMDINDIKTIN